jgi:transcriptional regulator with XRE-family HTH domain
MVHGCAQGIADMAITSTTTSPKEQYPAWLRGVYVADMPRKAISEGATARRAAMARRLRQLREVLEGNQAEVARNAGVSPSTWNRYEKGERDIDPSALAEFCLFYGVSADWVLLGDLLSLPKQVLVHLVAANPDLQQQLVERANEDLPPNNGEPWARRAGRGRSRG